MEKTDEGRTSRKETVSSVAVFPLVISKWISDELLINGTVLSLAALQTSCDFEEFGLD